MNPLNVIQEQSGICRRLRTKTSFGTFIGSANFWEDFFYKIIAFLMQIEERGTEKHTKFIRGRECSHCD